MRLPGIDGLALVQRCREIDAALPVIMITGHGDVSLAVQAMRSGAYDFIEKPFSPERAGRGRAARAGEARADARGRGAAPTLAERDGIERAS